MDRTNESHGPVARVILFTRFPRPGRVKTRLIPLLGPVGAAATHRRLAEASAALLDRLPAWVEREIWYTGGEEEEMAAWLGRRRRYVRQPGGDLGQRLGAAFQAAAGAGSRATVVVGADCPELTPELVVTALDILLAPTAAPPLVLGPARDGGFYLMGLTAPCPLLTTDIAWGSGTVLATMAQRARDLGLTCHYLPTLADVDRPTDLLPTCHGAFGGHHSHP